MASLCVSHTLVLIYQRCSGRAARSNILCCPTHWVIDHHCQSGLASSCQILRSTMMVEVKLKGWLDMFKRLLLDLTQASSPPPAPPPLSGIDFDSPRFMRVFHCALFSAIFSRDCSIRSAVVRDPDKRLRR